MFASYVFGIALLAASTSASISILPPNGATSVTWGDKSSWDAGHTPCGGEAVDLVQSQTGYEVIISNSDDQAQGVNLSPNVFLVFDAPGASISFEYTDNQTCLALRFGFDAPTKAPITTSPTMSPTLPAKCNVDVLGDQCVGVDCCVASAFTRSLLRTNCGKTCCSVKCDKPTAKPTPSPTNFVVPGTPTPSPTTASPTPFVCEADILPTCNPGACCSTPSYNMLCATSCCQSTCNTKKPTPSPVASPINNLMPSPAPTPLPTNSFCSPDLLSECNPNQCCKIRNNINMSRACPTSCCNVNCALEPGNDVDSNEQNGKSGLPLGGIIGLIILGLIVLVLVVVALIFVVGRGGSNAKEEPTASFNAAFENPQYDTTMPDSNGLYESVDETSQVSGYNDITPNDNIGNANEGYLDVSQEELYEDADSNGLYDAPELASQ